MKINDHDVEIKIISENDGNVVIGITVDEKNVGVPVTLKSDGTVDCTIDGGEWK